MVVRDQVIQSARASMGALRNAHEGRNAHAPSRWTHCQKFLGIGLRHHTTEFTRSTHHSAS